MTRRAEDLSYLREKDVSYVIENAQEQERNYVNKVQALLSVLSQIKLNKWEEGSEDFSESDWGHKKIPSGVLLCSMK